MRTFCTPSDHIIFGQPGFAMYRVIAMAPNPGRVMDELIVDLPRPRDDTSEAFNDLKRHIRGLISSAMAETAVAP